MVFDMVRRYLTYRGYDVTYVTNFTDVDDKIITRANETGEDPVEMADFFAEKYLEHLADLNVQPADIYPRVSEEINNIIQVIQDLGERGYAYEQGGDVYFRVEADDDSLPCRESCRRVAPGHVRGIHVDVVSSQSQVARDARCTAGAEDPQ